MSTPQLRRAPGFAVAAAHHNSGELVRLYETEDAPGHYPMTGPTLWNGRRRTTASDMTAFAWSPDMNLTGAGGQTM